MSDFQYACEPRLGQNIYSNSSQGRLAYLRVLPYQPDVGFILERELSAVLSPEERASLPRENAVELSRLVCQTGNDSPSNDSRTGQDATYGVELLLKRLYQLSLERGFTQFYIVVEASWLRPFVRRFGLPFRVIGQPHHFPDGTRTVAAVATRAELEAGMRAHSEAKYQWYRDGKEYRLTAGASTPVEPLA